MSDRLPYTQDGHNTSKLLAQAINATKVAQDLLNRVGAVLDSAIAGNPGDDAGVAAELGGVDLVQAHAAWTLVSNGRTKLNDAAINTMIARLDQG